MAQKRRVLGKGLASLIDNNLKDVDSPSDVLFNSTLDNNNKLKRIDAEYLEINLKDIVPNPNQPRKTFDTAPLKELADSIKTVGLLQPIIVKKLKSNKYELIMGERRYRATQLAGKTQIPAIIKKTDNNNTLVEALLENIHRVDLNPLEEAASYMQMIDDFNATHTEIATKLSKSRAYVTNILRLLKLPTSVQDMISKNKISVGHAKALLSLSDKSAIELLAQRILSDSLSVRQVEKLSSLKSITLINNKLNNDKINISKIKFANVKKGKKGSQLIEIEEKLNNALDTIVKINIGKLKGTIQINFATIDDLNRIVKEIIK
jgi:ParB family chromosome partitioning protein